MKSSMVRVAALAVAVVCSAALAQDAGAAAPASPPAAGPDAAKAAASDLKTGCKDDIAKLCPRVKPGAGRLAACLSGAKDKVSEGCKAAVEASVAAVKKFDEDCKADLQTHCKKVPVGQGRRLACLKGAKDKLQPACKAYFEAGGTPVDADAQD
ncbi:MAG: cysteine rich repeat-containing protein [Myxococcota bacterium]